MPTYKDLNPEDKKQYHRDKSAAYREVNKLRLAEQRKLKRVYQREAVQRSIETREAVQLSIRADKLRITQQHNNPKD
jgi:hypothetical protein